MYIRCLYKSYVEGGKKGRGMGINKVGLLLRPSKRGKLSSLFFFLLLVCKEGFALGKKNDQQGNVAMQRVAVGDGSCVL